MKLNLMILFSLLKSLQFQQLQSTCSNCDQQPILVDLEDRIHYGVLDPLKENVDQWKYTNIIVQQNTDQKVPQVTTETKQDQSQVYYYINSQKPTQKQMTNYYYISIDNNQKSLYLKSLQNDIDELKYLITQSYNQQQKQYLNKLLDQINKIYQLENNYIGQESVLKEQDLLQIRLQIQNFKNSMSQDYLQKLIKKYQDLLNYQQQWQDEVSDQFQKYQENMQQQQLLFQKVVREKEILKSQVSNDKTVALQEQEKMYTEILDKQRELIDKLLQELNQCQNDQKDQNQKLIDQAQQRQQLLTQHQKQNFQQKNQISELFNEYFQNRQDELRRVEQKRIQLWQQYIQETENVVEINDQDAQQIIQQLQDQMRKLDVLIQRQQILLSQQQNLNLPDYYNDIIRYLQEQYQRISQTIQQTLLQNQTNPNQNYLTKKELENLMQQQQIVLDIYLRQTQPQSTEGSSGASSGSNSSFLTVTTQGKAIRPTQDLYQAQFGTGALPDTVGADQFTVEPRF